MLVSTARNAHDVPRHLRYRRATRTSGVVILILLGVVKQISRNYAFDKPWAISPYRVCVGYRTDNFLLGQSYSKYTIVLQYRLALFVQNWILCLSRLFPAHVGYGAN